ncbi:Cys-tRNA(Pro) deacylase [Pseudooceanicola sp. CBS1P-1]|uniref:Cys-tRNA(Pro)/Cys-tRNA(Cys) deacylase n=1 Tax=Pseudooceanicola albus TaxID=2692189 RepID=A0A6L7GBN3_9RHOB|nr:MULTISPECIES: Cys-tRNA(Pro) deacylase [Pseudooceanicola]MBT9384419.1 Cys-tRNA(Pro) deacylase [Pseudooceanicola endophyticus]MXN20680.1 Cys-tRNA(Pro) deacylase [Pseudooceanicola albus]
MASSTTPATKRLTAAGVAFGLHEYGYESGHHIGEHAAAAIGADPVRVFKTLMLEVDGKPGCVVIPVALSVKLKQAAAALGGKSAQMMDPAKAERLTGFHVGGISPFGQKKRVPVVFDSSLRAHAQVILNGGRRGLMVELAPEDAIRVLQATLADLTG